MAGYLPREIEGFHKIPNTKLAIIGSMWHQHCVDAMIARAKELLIGLDVAEQDISEHRLPGSLELPYAARKLFELDSDLDAIIAFGVVLQGATTHDASVMQSVTEGFSLVSNTFGKPIINEVIGVTNLADAEKRSDHTVNNKGVEAVFAVSELINWQRSL